MVEILRIFQARPHRGKEDAYDQFLQGTSLPFLRRQPGMKRVVVGHSRASGRSEVVVLSWWASMEELRTAAGSNWEEGVVDPKQEAAMLEDFTCTHYEVREGTS